MNDPNTWSSRLTMEDWPEAQATDTDIKIVLVLYHAKQLCEAKMANYDSYDMKAYIKLRDKLWPRLRVFYYNPKDCREDHNGMWLVVP